MPGFATGDRTKSSAWSLMRNLGITGEDAERLPSAFRPVVAHQQPPGQSLIDVMGGGEDYLDLQSQRIARKHTGRLGIPRHRSEKPCRCGAAARFPPLALQFRGD